MVPHLQSGGQKEKKEINNNQSNIHQLIKQNRKEYSTVLREQTASIVWQRNKRASKHGHADGSRVMYVNPPLLSPSCLNCSRNPKNAIPA
jgi:hypothetical protein